ncbi:hypothetical protein JCM16408A_07700 [Methylobacterium phyllosphaerae]
MLVGLLATAVAPALPAPLGSSVPRVASGSTLSRVTAEGDAWLSYRRALLREICDVLQIDCAAFTRDHSEATAACLRVRLAAACSQSPIASAGARQGLPTAIIKPGAAS